jgi:hypothetical protein
LGIEIDWSDIAATDIVWTDIVATSIAWMEWVGIDNVAAVRDGTIDTQRDLVDGS